MFDDIQRARLISSMKIIDVRVAKEHDCPVQMQPCSGEKCMAWRWVPDMPAWNYRSDKHGYCGMVPHHAL